MNLSDEGFWFGDIEVESKGSVDLEFVRLRFEVCGKIGGILGL